MCRRGWQRPLILELCDFEGLLRGIGGIAEQCEGLGWRRALRPSRGEQGAARAEEERGKERGKAGAAGSQQDVAWQRAEGHTAAPGAGEGPADHRPLPEKQGVLQLPHHPQLRQSAFPSLCRDVSAGRPRLSARPEIPAPSYLRVVTYSSALIYF